MSQENLAWLAEELGFAGVVRMDDGTVHLNSTAEARFGAQDVATLPEALVHLADGALTVADANRLADAAQSDGRASLALATGRLFVFRGGDGRLHAWATPDPVAVAREVQQRAAAADLAAGVSHEVSNALSGIIGWAQLSQERPDKAPPAESLKLIERSAQAARGAARDLLRMMRSKDQETTTQTNLTTLVQDVIRLLRPEAQKKLVVVEREAEPGCWVKGSESQLFSIVWNLAHNAVQSANDGDNVRILVRQQQGDTVVLEVIDDGPGMSAAQRDRVFERYYTTRKDGTGLGLSIVRGTIEALGGKIRLDTSPGDGARFHIVLPGAEVQTGVSEVRNRSVRISKVIEPSAADATVLVVEDDAGIRDLVATTLGVCGLKAITFADAASVLAADEATYSIAVLDLTLPDERGDRLLATLRDRGIVTRAIIMTGGPPPDSIAANGAPERWVRKPFEPSEIVVAIREQLGLGDDTDKAEAS